LPPLTNSVALVTGASRGIGAAAAIRLAQLGAHVVITARTQGGLEETDDAIQTLGGNATLLPLDLADGAQVDAIGPSLYQRFGRLDALVHAAGSLGRLTPAPHILAEDWADVLAVNLNAVWHLIRTCDPLLREAPNGRAAFVTDQRAREPKAYWGAYGTTKAAMEHLVLTWADEVRITPLLVNLYDPGPTATRLRSRAMPGEDPTTLPRPSDVAPALAALCLPSERRHASLVRYDPSGDGAVSGTSRQ
jgi:NAD(P)-dependent dehydrogenase (short-subunit alcohol dehydrogenase family)